MRKKITLITGANGEIGQGLIKLLYKKGINNIVAFDLLPSNNEMQNMITDQIIGDILDSNLLESINEKYEITELYHLAALLSTKSELYPEKAHEVNVTGTINLLTLALKQGKLNNCPVKFFFPSSIAVYSIDKNNLNKITEEENNNPKTMYGCNKLYCENIGSYYSKKYSPYLIDFRCIRFPGIISPYTIPTGGTSDYLPEMLHSVIKNKPYKCFVKKNTRMPFMIMPDAVSAIYLLMNAQKNKLCYDIYNITSFNPSPEEFLNLLKEYVHDVNVSYQINEERQKMVDSWPSDINDSKAFEDWGWKPKYNLKDSFEIYLIPALEKFYNIKVN